MSKETKTTELLKKLSDQIWLDDLDEQFQKVYEDLKKLENDPVISADVPRLTEEQAAIIMALSGISCGPFELFHKYAQEKLDRPIWTHEFAMKELMAEIKEASRDDFLSICCLQKYDNE